ncbi:hypothetical protein LGT39_13200 [Demequina sp. TTPB684]|uniref:hypothetical protein n=1 Tax=unclassified Demequina TaxID=2620311 RepID=UPI001CF45923|nr:MULTISPECIES: hypothetical protein [unclassified Demequina]MCB2413801.1 hypothetical protein [Demequina sp. TTPB684]UPU89291.1 hypothetical protein LGT36_005020 [Demequina sp. TMPB413]
MHLFVTELRRWPAKRWWFAVGTAVATYLVIALPTALIDNPVFGREVPPTPWATSALLASSLLAGLVAATYVAGPDAAPRKREGRLGWAGGLVTFFAVGCPVCNKLVLIALGYTGAIQYFAPVQPFLAAAAIVLLGWAFVARVRRESSCRIPVRSRVSIDA